MKLLLSVTISIKDYFPKDKSIQYENYICLFSHNNFTEKINLSNLQNQNFIRHKVETCNSNIVYNLHMFDSNKNSLIGIYQLVINYDKIKNLNVNDALTQEETAKLIIDPKTKRKIFDKITNMGDIYLCLSTEIKILDKNLYSSGNKQPVNMFKKYMNSENSEIEPEFNLTPRTFKKRQLIRTMKNDREALKRIEAFARNNEINSQGFFKDENEALIFSPESTIKKYKSLNIAKMKPNNNKYIDYSNNMNNQCFNNSCTVIMSPKHYSTNYNFKKDGQIKTNKKRKIASKKKVTILNLMEQKIEPSLYIKKEENTLELSTQLKDFKNTSVNFSKSLNNNSKKNSFNSLKYHYSFKENKNNNSINKMSLKHFEQSDYFQRKSYQNKNIISVNLSGNNKIEKTFSGISKNIKNNNKKKLSLNNIGRLNSEINKNDYLYKSTNLNNIFLQTETTMKKLTERKRDLRKNILTDADFKQLIKEKDSLIRENFNNKYYMEKGRGTFSPKLSLKINFNNGIMTSNEKTEINTNRYKERINKKILTPKGNKIRKVGFNGIDNFIKENEEIKKKYFNLIDFYSLLTKKLKQTSKNNIQNIKKLEILKERYNNLNKYKYKIIEIQNLNESKKVKSHVNSHYEEEKLLNKMINLKTKENSIYLNIFGNYSAESNIQNKISILISQKREILINLTRNIVKYYGNISQIYNDDKIKKNLLLELLDKYDIKEKINTDLNYINYIHKGNNFDDRIITEVDEDKENDEEDEEKIESQIDIDFSKNIIKNESNSIDNLKSEEKTNINDNNNNIFKDNFEHTERNRNNKIQEIKIFNIKSKRNKDIDNNINNNVVPNIDNNIDKNNDENLNNLIKKILIEQFPKNYNTNISFTHQEKNKYLFKNKIFYAYIENNDVVLKEETNGTISTNKLTLNEIYELYCNSEIDLNKSNYVYTKKIRQKYIKIKTSDTEQSTEQKLKNENSTTIETENKLNMSNSKINEGLE